MAGNVWQWTGDVYEGMHYRFLRGGSKDTYKMDLRIWVRNNATPTYFSPGVGFRCAQGGDLSDAACHPSQEKAGTVLVFNQKHANRPASVYRIGWLPERESSTG